MTDCSDAVLVDVEQGDSSGADKTEVLRLGNG